MGEVLKFIPTNGKGCFRRLCGELNCKKVASKFIELEDDKFKYFCNECAPDWAENLNGL